jgi:lipid-A-disaccharide synthase
LFTAFEPSGDDHAAAVISEVRRRDPGRPIYAWGGPKMEAAGAVLVERTGEDAVMGVPGLKKIAEHRAINRRIAAWLDEHPVAAHVPVDSPAANFPICALARARGVKVVHFVSPQVWAWATWRVHKLRRLTDHVCCVLPFEEPWLRQRHVPATFVGHPLFDQPLDRAALARATADWPHPAGGPRLAVLPGSRPKEITRNFPLLLAAFLGVLERHPDAAGVVALTRPELEPVVRRLADDHGLAWPASLQVVARRTDETVHWCSLCLVVSGTVTLQIAKQQRPMVIVYKSGRLMYTVLGRFLIHTPFFTLPNLLMGRAIVPELVPHFGGHEPVLRAALDLIDSPEAMAEQTRALGVVCERFAGKHAASSAAEIILRVASGAASASPRAQMPQPTLAGAG